jgi:hypothetical protein
MWRQVLPAPAQFHLQVGYSTQQLGVVDESSLALYYWDGSQWVEEPSSQGDTSGDIVSATPQHFSLWAILSTTHNLYLPDVVRAAP